ncbi:hypothetical protein NDU88_005617, partial [Pleurodeles waltl]
ELLLVVQERMMLRDLQQWLSSLVPLGSEWWCWWWRLLWTRMGPLGQMPSRPL